MSIDDRSSLIRTRNISKRDFGVILNGLSVMFLSGENRFVPVGQALWLMKLYPGNFEIDGDLDYYEALLQLNKDFPGVQIY